MKISRPSCRPAAAFTMIEIAMSLAVIGFALVAIIGVLPMGMNVQKDNRRETIVNQDANYLLQAIRSGTTNGFNDLTNYVTSVTNYWTTYTASTNLVTLPGMSGSSGMDTYTNNGTANGVVSLSSVLNSLPYALTNGANIIGLLSTPSYVSLPGGNFRSNYVVAYMRAMSGDAAEKYPQTNSLVRDSAFGYRLVPQVVPWNSIPTYIDPTETNFADPGLMASPGLAIPLVTNWAQSLATNGNLSITNFTAYYTNGGVLDVVSNGSLNIDSAYDETVFEDRAKAWVVDRTLQNNLYDVRLLFRWLLLPNGQVGNGRQLYRMTVGGTLTNQYSTVTNGVVITTNLTPFWYFQSQSYAALGTNSL